MKLRDIEANKACQQPARFEWFDTSLSGRFSATRDSHGVIPGCTKDSDSIDKYTTNSEEDKRNYIIAEKTAQKSILRRFTIIALQLIAGVEEVDRDYYVYHGRIVLPP